MEKHKLLVLMNYNDNKECLVDTLNNIFHMNDSVCVIINNGTNEDLSDITSNLVHVFQRQSDYSRFETIIPLHLQMYDYIKEHNLKSDMVLMMASNQAFINHGFVDWAKQYKGAYFERDVDQGCIRDLMFVTVFTKYFRELGPQNFIYQTNHDGCFFHYDDFVEMMNYLKDYRGTRVIHHNEEFIYVAYLISKYGVEQLAPFGQYNYWTHNWWCGGPNLTVEEVEQCMEKGMFLVKRVERDMTDPVRTYIRENIK